MKLDIASAAAGGAITAAALLIVQIVETALKGRKK